MLISPNCTAGVRPPLLYILNKVLFPQYDGRSLNAANSHQNETTTPFLPAIIIADYLTVKSPCRKEIDEQF